ncbi:pantoate--beta-alanine ligase [Corynebacterium hylobatis]|uniref:pantoate--beta-alanine ligase (AMP-forming) n=1 Tax=Corynebacterium hylobatis TaxID=1859290 RepID=A0A3R9ZK77_9CORY|nr:pantoate--beta-alanine ligase [Corynebacterium hylobatis]RSZ65107.1 pantoate--beta-alanine ligase [Corynebacterium hylobatis]
MSFTPGQATEFGLEQISVLARAMRRSGRPVVLIPLGAGLHAGHIALVRAARRLPRAVVLVAWSGEEVPSTFAEEGVDAVFRYTQDALWPRGLRTLVQPVDLDLEPVEEVARQLTLELSLINVVGPSDVVVGEKDYEQMRALQAAITDLHLPVKLHGVPTVRMPDGLAVSLRNSAVAESAREQALALSAALTAGAHTAEHGAETVLEVARGVLDTAGVAVDYLEVRGLDLGDAPETGDARLLVSALIGGVRLTDNVGLPLGIGFRNIEG